MVHKMKEIRTALSKKYEEILDPKYLEVQKL